MVVLVFMGWGGMKVDGGGECSGKKSDGGEWKLLVLSRGKVLKGPTSSPPGSLELVLHRGHKCTS